jgi:hypothetical protein
MASTRPGMFSTNRGRRVMKITWAAFACSLALMMASNASNNSTAKDATAQQAPTTGVGAQAVKAPPKVAYFPANPYQAASKEKVDVPSAGDTTASAVYQAMLGVAQKGAIAFGTYSFMQTPEQYVDQIPGLDPAAKDALQESVKKNWATVKDTQTTVQASQTAVGINPMIYSVTPGSTGQQEGKAQVAIILNQSITNKAGETSTRTSPVLVWLSLKANPSSTQPATWVITGLSR